MGRSPRDLKTAIAEGLSPAAMVVPHDYSNGTPCHFLTYNVILEWNVIQLVESDGWILR